MKKAFFSAFLATFFLASCGNANLKLDYDPVNYQKATSENIFETNISKIDITWTSGNVELRYYSGDKIRVTENAAGTLDDNTSMYMKNMNGELDIQFAKNGRHKSQTFANLNKTLLVEIPENHRFVEIEIETVDANMTSDGLAGDKIDIESVSGKIELTNPVCRELDVQSVSGDINLSFGTLPNEIDIEDVSGSVEILVPASSNFMLEKDKFACAFNCNIPYTTRDAETLVFGNGFGCKMDIDMVGGSLKIAEGK